MNEEEMICLKALRGKYNGNMLFMFYDGLERKNALAICYLCCYNISSLKSPPSPIVMIPFVNHCASLGCGIVSVLLNHFIRVGSCYGDVA